MSWAKLDDRFHAHRKAKRAWREPRALGLHLLALSYCAGQLTDGLVDDEFVEEKIPASRERVRATDALVSAGLWAREDEGWRINDWLEYNPSREEVQQRRAKEAERKAAARAARAAVSASCPPGHPPDSARSPQVVREASVLPDPTRPDPAPITAEDSPVPGPVETPDVAQVFDAWVQSTGRDQARTKLTPERRRLILAALRSHGLDDCLAAVTNLGRDPFAMGQNDRHTPFNDVEHALKGARRIEKYRDWQGTARSTRQPTVADIQAAQRARQAAERDERPEAA